MADTAFITGAAALFGAVIGATITLVVAKRNLKKEISLKMAEYRLQWINNLGKEFANFSAGAATSLIFSKNGLDPEIFKSVTTARINILMLMNIKDKDYNKLQIAMEDLATYSGSFLNKEINQEIIVAFYAKIVYL
jgi:hypothetical protein